MNGIAHGTFIGTYPGMDNAFMMEGTPLKNAIGRYKDKGGLSALIQDTVKHEPAMMFIIYQRWPQK